MRLFGLIIIFLLMVGSVQAIDFTRGTTFFDELYCQLIGCEMTGDLIAQNITAYNVSLTGSRLPEDRIFQLRPGNYHRTGFPT